MQIPVQLPSLPIQIVCAMNGQIGFVRQQDFNPVIDFLDEDLVTISVDSVTIGDTVYEYNTGYFYKEDVKLLKWLQSFNMILPQFNNPFGF